MWALDTMVDKKGHMQKNGKQEQLLHSFMRQALGVRDSTPVGIMMSEMGRQPIWVFWVRQCCGFWNRVVSRIDVDIIKMCIKENVNMAISGNTSCWAYSFFSILMCCRCD